MYCFFHAKLSLWNCWF